MEELRRITGLLWSIVNAPESPEKLAICQEAVRLAEALGQKEIRFKAGLWLIHAATFQDRPELALVEMSRCLAIHEEDPEKYDGFGFVHSQGGGGLVIVQNPAGIHWALKWVLGSLTAFPEIGREQIEAAFEQAIGLYGRRGLNLHPIHGVRTAVAWEMGDRELAREEARLWRETPRDEGADCRACERTIEVDLLCREGRFEAAVRQARPLVDGSLRCNDRKEKSMSNLLVPLLRLGRGNEAVRLHRRGRLISLGVEGRLGSVAHHVRFLASIGGWDAGWKIVEDFAARIEPLRDGEVSLHFFSAWRCLLESSRAHGGPVRFVGRLPPAMSACRVGGEYDAEMLTGLLTRRIESLATAFDRRNGNDHVTRRMEKQRETTVELWSPSLCPPNWR